MVITCEAGIAARRLREVASMLDTIREDLKVYIRARYPVLYLVSGEEERVDRMLGRIAADLQ
jgi:hypothetical protein